jgi:hypothetical protein
MSDDYYTDLMQLRQQTIANRREMVAQEAQNIADDIRRGNEQARELLRNGQTEAAQGVMENIFSLEADLQSRYLQLEPREQQQQMSQAKQEWIARRQDLASNPIIAQGAALYHDYIVNKMGVKDDSPEYFELMSMVVEPQNYQPMMTPSEAAKISGVDARTYNQGVNRFLAEKAAGAHKDRQ